jgi:alpha-glucosidase (family GH31 glycosyl hydrolase)
MANRVCFGNRSGGAGFFVSKPGVDVLTASSSGMMLSTNDRSMQIVASGVLNRSSGTETISWSPLGYRPLLILVGQNFAQYVYLDDNSASVRVQNRQGVFDNYWTVTGKPTLSPRIEWLAIRPGV